MILLPVALKQTTTSKLSMGTANLNGILGSQNCVFEKVGIGYQCGFQGK